MKYINTACVSPILKVCDTEFNSEEIIRIVKELDEKKVNLAVFPELSVTGYTCQDMFLQDSLLNSTLSALEKIRKETEDLDIIFAVGAPLRNMNAVYNCGVLIGHGKYLGVVPKVNIPNYNEFYEGRWFKGYQYDPVVIKLNGQEIPFGNIVFRSPFGNIGIEICEDLWSVNSPSDALSLNGADIILNLSASNEVVAKADYRRELVNLQSSKALVGYAYSSCGVNESTTDVVFSGHLIISELGSKLNENKRFNVESEYISSFIDIDKIRNLRNRNATYRIERPDTYSQYVDIPLKGADLSVFDRYTDPHPFIPDNDLEMAERCNEILNIQAHGLASRMRKIGIKKAVLGISGGLDSTLALLVTLKAMKINRLSAENIVAVTMPGFGTTDRTYDNAVSLIKEIGCEFREINIVEASLLHFKDIGHDKDIHDSAYENTQARERTQILMDIANEVKGLVVGTGDLSELALGWATYNGDHMSMYGVNASIPKTLVRYLTRYVAENESTENVRKILLDILDTPVSPELLPKSKEGKIQQKTEDIIGPYELHDFFLFHMMKYGAPYDKILFLAKHAFKEKYTEEEIRKWLDMFIKRFFSNQFKRSALPDGPKVGSVSLSPRGDLKMPSDASYNVFLGK